MKKQYRIFLILLAFAFVLVFPETSFAVSNLNPDAAYTITDKQGKTVVPQYDYLTKEFVNFPQKGDTVKVFYNGNTSGAPDETYVYNGSIFDGGDDLLKLEYKVPGVDYPSSTVDLRIYRQVRWYVLNDDMKFDINQKTNVSVVRAPLKSLAYSPSNIRLEGEKIKITTVDGKTRYKFSKRTTKSSDGHSMESENAIGDKAIVTLQDGTTTTYNSTFTSQNGSYGIRFVNSNGESLRVYAKNIELFKGNNTVSFYIPKNEDIVANVNVYVWTPDMGAYPGDFTEEPSSPQETPENRETIAAPDKTKVVETADQKAIEPAEKKEVIASIKNVKASRKGKKIKVSWKGLSKTQRTTVSKIQVQYGTNKRFANATKVWVKKNQKTYISKKLKKGKYYIRIRSARTEGKKTLYSKWSAVKSIKIR